MSISDDFTIDTSAKTIKLTGKAKKGGVTMNELYQYVKNIMRSGPDELEILAAAFAEDAKGEWKVDAEGKVEDVDLSVSQLDDAAPMAAVPTEAYTIITIENSWFIHCSDED